MWWEIIYIGQKQTCFCYCIIVLHCTAWSHSLSDLTVPRYLYGYGLTKNSYRQIWFVTQWLTGLTSKREVLGSNPTVDKNFSFCNSRSLRVPHSSTESIQMKSTMTITKPIPCFSLGMICILFVHLILKDVTKTNCRWRWVHPSGQTLSNSVQRLQSRSLKCLS